jgi:hypothetical protein
MPSAAHLPRVSAARFKRARSAWTCTCAAAKRTARTVVKLQGPRPSHGDSDQSATRINLRLGSNHDSDQTTAKRDARHLGPAREAPARLQRRADTAGRPGAVAARRSAGEVGERAGTGVLHRGVGGVGAKRGEEQLHGAKRHQRGAGRRPVRQLPDRLARRALHRGVGGPPPHGVDGGGGAGGGEVVALDVGVAGGDEAVCARGGAARALWGYACARWKRSGGGVLRVASGGGPNGVVGMRGNGASQVVRNSTSHRGP